jgi:hypothetical protein
VVAKIFTVPLPFSTVPALPSDGLQFAISHPIPRMSILVTSLRQPAVLPTASPSPLAKARSHEVGLTQALAWNARLPFAGRNRRTARQGAGAAPARGGLKSHKLVKHPPQPAVFASLHFAAALEARAGRGKTPPATRRDDEPSHSAPTA